MHIPVNDEVHANTQADVQTAVHATVQPDVHANVQTIQALVHARVQPPVHAAVQPPIHAAVQPTQAAVHPPVQVAVQPPIQVAVQPPIQVAVQPPVHMVQPVQSVHASPHGTQDAPPAIAITVYAAVESRAVPVAFRNFLLERSSFGSNSFFSSPSVLIRSPFSFFIIYTLNICILYNRPETQLKSDYTFFLPKSYYRSVSIYSIIQGEN